MLDSFGDIVWETDVPSSSRTDPVVASGDDLLESGMFYQFRVTSFRTSSGNECEISHAEDLCGVFLMP